MNYSADKPITKNDQDKLGRSLFSKQLGRAIYKYKGKESLTIGVFGKWGTGKTSVINMALEEINKLTKNDINKPLVMKFTPWNYSNQNNLISLFFHDLKTRINAFDNEELKKKVGKALSDYSDIFDFFSLIPGLGSSVSSTLKNLAEKQGDKMTNESSLDDTREKLNKALIEIDKKIIVVIDDIDRLTNSQIRDVFQLVKQVADFPNIIYLLSMDRDVVSRALAEVHNINGEEYLEKIIQIPIEIPELNNGKLFEIYISKIEEILEGLSKKIMIDQNYWQNVFNNCIKPFVKTLRDVNRVINTFQFKYDMVYYETSLEDMLAITTIEVLEPNLYKWIYTHKEEVCGGVWHNYLSDEKNQKDWRKYYSEEFERNGIDSVRAIKFLSTLFPVFANDVKEYGVNYQSPSDIRGKMRAAHENKFDLYFMFNVDDIKISREIINRCATEYNLDELQSTVEKINADGNISYFLDELDSLTDSIPYERLSLIVNVLYELQQNLRVKREGMFSISPYDKAQYMIIGIIKRLKTETERNDIYNSLMEKTNKYSLGSMADMINSIEIAYGRIDGTRIDITKQLISEGHLNKLEESYKAKIKKIVKNEDLFGINKFYQALFFWKSIDMKEADKYIRKISKNNINKLRLICSTAGRWNGTNGSGWIVKLDYYSDYFSTDNIYKIILSNRQRIIKEFSKEDQAKLAAVILNWDKDDMEYATDQEAESLVQDWLDEYNK